MADLPPRRLSASIQRHVSVFEKGMDAEPKQVSKEERFEGVQLDSGVTMESTGNMSDLSMSEEELNEDDLLDDDEEYQKEMEDQRIVDAKNGHFEEDPPSVRTSATADEAAEYLALSLAAFPLGYAENLMMSERKSSSLEKEENRVNNGKGGCSTKLHVGHCSKACFNEDTLLKNHMAAENDMLKVEENVRKLNAKGTSDFQGCHHGKHSTNSTNSSNSTENSQPFFEESMAAMSSLQIPISISIGNEEALNAEVALSSFASFENVANNSPDFMQMELLSPAVHGHVNGDENALLDLAETRTLVDQHTLLDAHNGPSILGPAPHASGQVCFPQPNSESFISGSPATENSPNPNAFSLPSAQTIIHQPKHVLLQQPNTDPLLFPQSSAQIPTQQPIKLWHKSKFPLPKPPAHFKIKSSAFSSSKAAAQPKKKRTPACFCPCRKTDRPRPFCRRQPPP